MGTGYTRNDTLNNIADGNIINASDLDGEFDAVESAFNESTGHTHDGTAAEGAPITVLGPVQDFIASATEIKPKTTNTLDIGTVSLQFKDMYLDGTAYIDGLGEDILVATDKKVQFRDTALFINSSVDGQLDIDADVELELVAPTVDIDASTAVTIDTATLTITGSANVVGDLDVDNININGNTISSTDTNGNITLAPNGTGVVALSSTDLTFGDNDKAIFGAGSDLQIYHDGSNSYIHDNGTGDLFIRGSSNVYIQNSGGGSSGAQFVAGGAANINYAGVTKLATTATGVDVTGTVTADGLTVSASTPVIRLTDTDTNIDSGLDAGSGAGFLYIDFDRNNETAGGGIIMRQHGSTNVFKADANGDISFYEDTGTTAKFFWDASAEFLGVGTSSPNSVLHLSTSNDPQITLTDTGFGASADITGSNGNLRLNSQTATIFDMADSEVVRIDSSGIVLVGKTSTTNSVAGIELNNTGQLVATFASGTHILGRNTTDGSILQFDKDGTTLGNISSIGSGIKVTADTYLGLGSDDTGLRIASNEYILPYNPSTNSLRDAAIDLGVSSARWQNLFLSGGVYLGGTGSANRLDDYEEGTWTPALGGTWTSNPTSLVGNYTKIGRIVTVYLKFVGGTKTGSGTGYFTGLPFATTVNGTGAVIDSSLNDKGNSLAANTDRIWVSGTSFPNTNYTVLTYYT